MRRASLFSVMRHVNVECETHIHAMLEIVLVLRGVLQMTVSGKPYEIREGEGIFVAPLEPHAFHSAEPNACQVLVFSREMVWYFFEFVQSNSPSKHLFSVSKEAASLCERLLSDGSEDYVGAQAALAPLCYDVIHGCAFEPRKHASDDTLERMLTYIDAHFQEELTLESVARAIGVHPVTLCKSFSKRAGVGFHAYLQYSRCSFAANLIRTSEMSFSEIAYESGFGSIRSFNRAFQCVYRATPTEYKRSFSSKTRRAEK